MVIVIAFLAGIAVSVFYVVMLEMYKRDWA